MSRFHTSLSLDLMNIIQDHLLILDSLVEKYDDSDGYWILGKSIRRKLIEAGCISGSEFSAVGKAQSRLIFQNILEETGKWVA